MDLILDILLDEPALWEGWKAGKNAQGVSKQPKINKYIAQELKRRHGPTIRSDSAIGAWVSGKTW